MGNSFPSKPSNVPGYVPISGNTALPGIKRQRIWSVVLILTTVAVAYCALYFESENNWYSDLDVPYFTSKASDLIKVAGVLVFAVMVLGIVGSAIQMLFGAWKQDFDAEWRRHQDQNAGVVAEHISVLLDTEDGYRWFRPGNWGDAYMVISASHLILVNLTHDWISYIQPGHVLDVQCHTRRTGAETESRTHAQTLGSDYYIQTAQTDAQTTSKTTDHYTHSVDIYTNVSGNEHLHANFSDNESLAKQAFAQLIQLRA